MEKIGKLGEQGEMGGSGYFDRHGPRGLVGDIWGKTQKGTKEQTDYSICCKCPEAEQSDGPEERQECGVVTISD